jgi:hypothetical protein
MSSRAKVGVSISQVPSAPVITPSR